MRRGLAPIAHWGYVRVGRTEDGRGRMLKKVESAIKGAFRKLDLRVTSYSRFDRLKSYERDHASLAFLKAIEPAAAAMVLPYLDQSRAQLHQDLFAYAVSGGKKGGFFVEFGATNGEELSNSWLLEKQFGWTGILAEPARVWHSALRANRSAIIETDCVWKTTGDSLEFLEVSAAVLSTVAEHGDGDLHRGRRKNATSYRVTTVSLADMLARHGAPREIDFLSIDTEGSEFDILQAFDFSLYRFACIAVEHNFTENRERIHALLTKHGYRRVHEDASQFDDWYVAA